MRQRQRVLLALIEELKEKNALISKTFLDKLLFLLKKEHGMDKLLPFYNFYPHDYGPFSSHFYLDLADLQSRGCLDEKLNPIEEGQKEAQTLQKEAKEAVGALIGREFTPKTIISYVYEKYPEYAVRSKLLVQKRKKEQQPEVFSIGYEKNDIDLFLDRLIQNGIETLVDVRANPFSMNFAFTKGRLESSLKKVGIGYLHMPELGIDGSLRKNLNEEEDYEELFLFYKENLLPKNQESIEKLARLGKEKRIALMCFEAEKEHCHRGVLSEMLEGEYGLKVKHL